MPIKQPEIKPLTQAEKEVLRLISEEFLTPKQIQHRRQCSRQAFYKIFKSLKQKGAINTGLQMVDKNEGLTVNQPKFNSNYVRLHGQEFNIQLLYQDQNYQKAVNRSNILFINGHTIKLYRNSLEIYAGEGTSFYGEDAQEAFSKSLVYWKKFVVRLENDLKVILTKPRSQNIRIVNQHFARGDSEIYDHAMKDKKQIKIYAKEDGKLAWITDDSFGFNEDETVHPKTAKPDREEIDKHINDWRTNHPPTNSQLATHIQSLGQYTAQNAQNLDQYAIHLKAHVESVQKLGSAVQELTEVVKDLKKKDI